MIYNKNCVTNINKSEVGLIFPQNHIFFFSFVVVKDVMPIFSWVPYFAKITSGVNVMSPFLDSLTL
jgi:hypothetical protein